MLYKRRSSSGIYAVAFSFAVLSYAGLCVALLLPLCAKDFLQAGPTPGDSIGTQSLQLPQAYKTDCLFASSICC
jgi:hypothetical protein